MTQGQATAMVSFDEPLRLAVYDAADELAVLAGEPQRISIRERDHVQVALERALLARVGNDHVVCERRYDFQHWQGLTDRRLGGVDVSLTDDCGRLALIELKWCPLDGKYLGWAIWDFYKMTTGRFSPGADACYLVAGAPDALWQQEGTVGELFATHSWDIREVFARHETVWFGDGNDCRKLTRLPRQVETILVVDYSLPGALSGWSIKGIRIEPLAPIYVHLLDGRLR